METSIIEQFDQSRYNLVKWLTIGWAVWFGTYILKDLIDHEIVMLQFLVAFGGCVGFGFWVVNLHRYLRLSSKIKHSRFNDALNNEWHNDYKYKSSFVGFIVLLATIGLFFISSFFDQLSAKVVCEITLYMGLLSYLMAWLICNKG